MNKNIHNYSRARMLALLAASSALTFGLTSQEVHAQDQAVEENSPSTEISSEFQTTPAVESHAQDVNEIQADDFTSAVRSLDVDNQSQTVPSQDTRLAAKEIGSYDSAAPFDKGGTEIVSFNPKNDQLYSVNGYTNAVEVIDASNPSQLKKVSELKIEDFGIESSGLTSVAVHPSGKYVAAAAPAKVEQENGSVVFVYADGSYASHVKVGPLPDNIVFTHDGKKLLVANEGEPNDDYTVNPVGGISVIALPDDISTLSQDHVHTVEIKAEDLPANIRPLGPNPEETFKNAEPEFIVVDAKDQFAYVSLQEVNALAKFDITNEKFVDVQFLGYKDYSIPGYEIDPSDKDGKLHLRRMPVLSLGQPDAIDIFEVNGETYLILPNEGDAQDYKGYSEETRVKDLAEAGLIDLKAEHYEGFSQDELDAMVKDGLFEKNQLGRLKVTTSHPFINEEGKHEALVGFGGRGFTIVRGSDLEIVYDSANDFEKYILAVHPDRFNQNFKWDEDAQKAYGEIDSRSDDKASEPETAVVGTINGQTYAFIALERTGGIMVYNVSQPDQAYFENYIYSADNRHISPEGLDFVPAEDSPTGNPLLFAAHELSGTIAVYELSQVPAYQIGKDVVALTDEAGSEYIYREDPNRIIATLTEDPAHSMAFNWYQSNLDPQAKLYLSTSSDMSQAIEVPAKVEAVESVYFLRNKDGYIVYGADLDKDGKVDGYFTEAQISSDNMDWMGGLGPDFGEATKKTVTEYVYKVQVDGLKAGKTYYYTVGRPGNMSAVGQFTTDNLDDRVVFVQYTDTQNAYWNEKVHNQSQYGADTLKQAILQAQEELGGADFAVHNGDVVEFQWSEDEWYDLMNQSQESYLNMPHVVAPGNHDGMEFLNHFNAPSADGQRIEGSYYSFDYGNIHFTVVNTNENGETTDLENRKSKPMMTDIQIEWLKNDLASTDKDWKIVIAHKPLYSAGFNGLQQPDMMMIRGQLMQILEDYDVDLVMSGHAHSTAITKPLVYDADSFTEARPTDNRQMEDGKISYVNPEGTIFFLPNLASPDAIDATLAKDFAGIDQTAGFLGLTKMMTEEQLAEYQSLFTAMEQPAHSSSKTLFGNHDSSTTNFATYEVEGGELIISLYQVDGHMDREENRRVSLTHQVRIVKDNKQTPEKPANPSQPDGTNSAKEDQKKDDHKTDNQKTDEKGQINTPKDEKLKDKEDDNKEGSKQDRKPAKENQSKTNASQQVNIEPAEDEKDKASHQEDKQEKSVSTEDSESTSSELPQTGLTSTPAVLALSSIILGLGLSRRRKQ